MTTIVKSNVAKTPAPKPQSKTDATRAAREARATREAAPPAPASGPAVRADVPPPAPTQSAPSVPDADPSGPAPAYPDPPGKIPLWKLSPAHTRAVRMRRAAQRLEQTTVHLAGMSYDVTDDSGEVVGNAFALAAGHARNAIAALRAGATVLERVPLAWRPRVTSGTSPGGIVVGAIVSVRTGHRAEYEGLGFAAADLDAMRVVSTNGKTVAVTLAGDTARIFFPRSHLRTA